MDDLVTPVDVETARRWAVEFYYKPGTAERAEAQAWIAGDDVHALDIDDDVRDAAEALAPTLAAVREAGLDAAEGGAKGVMVTEMPNPPGVKGVPVDFVERRPPDNYRKEFGNAVRLARRGCGLTMGDVARWYGVNVSVISAIEHGYEVERKDHIESAVGRLVQSPSLPEAIQGRLDTPEGERMDLPPVGGTGLRLEVDDGKYTFVRREGDYRVTVLRYGEDWLTIEKGSKAVLALMYELDELRQPKFGTPVAELAMKAELARKCLRNLARYIDFAEPLDPKLMAFARAIATDKIDKSK